MSRYYMNNLRKAGIAILGTAVAVESYAALARFESRKRNYAAALALSKRTGRTLVVIGDPDSGAHTRLLRAYDGGDVCVDLNGCPNFPNSIAADITQGLPQIPDNSAVVFVSCVLEYVSDPQAAIREIMRMAGSSQYVFNVNVQPWSATAFMYPGAKSVISGDVHNPVASDIGFARPLAWGAIVAAGIGLFISGK